ncbi:ABC-type transport system permease protein (probable substrate dipeptide/oligopeptide) [Natrialba magadii ATCC 43099]|uniref:ABC-type transport system permease protein (Probable substrate dipeptide/oligopeptide) n=1 Tax=Natrialba magadii (strain ATCC 43099 / DSM 3394 / CCM 3739 / CIP 104546 / IAM 13178 / JCM 8861 / NBRC 102185 / NCIMB 2190 / MS3) TaxID=547559 RepID=D3SYQ6_NATMM|nr:ABC transporter permease [Natrialba magadii]ADD04167.1 ABC-type transport system permease protein (probable substrate dipeptide/oligopeptide) [Natrialba magadii ATCC 43099]ELY32953.1 binding-protein-dependent transport system inner membrane protein [Natrialba magadii ATCC 43099]
MSTERGRIQISGFDTDGIEEQDSLDTWSEEEADELESRWRKIVSNIVHDRLALGGFAVICVMTVAALLSQPISVGGVTVQPFSIVPYDPTATGVGARYASPSISHPMGTDRLGRDMFSRVVAGGRYSISIGLVVTALAATFGVIYGSVSGYFGGRVDEVLMRILDVVFAFPGLVLALILVALFGGGFWPLVGAFALVGWATYARIIRGEILKVKQNEYVMAAKALGARDRSVIFRHVIPNAIAPVIVQATLSIGTVVIGVAALGFLGLGFDPGTPEWGTILDAESDTLATGDGGTWFWWATVFPGLMIFLFVMSMNIIGDAVNDALDAQVDDIGGGG